MDVTDVSAVEYRSVIRFLLIRGFTSADVLSELSLAYGSKAPSRTTVYFWISEFKRGRQSVEQDSLSPDFLHEAFKELKLRWEKVTDVNGSYIEK